VESESGEGLRTHHSPSTLSLHVRVATDADVPALRTLIIESVRGLSAGYYTPAQAESALVHVFGPDTQLIVDGTYYVVESAGTLVAAGGWSHRRTHYGGDQTKSGEDPDLDPKTEPARIRAFFVHPAWARRGLGRLLFEHCRAAARAAGFRDLTLVATLPGVPLYEALGFVAQESFAVPMPGGLDLPVIRMTREI
jgi:GNAT superfamily N-acetyltransferase